jgi:hypothetical protein
MPAANDNTPTQITVSGELCFGRERFPAKSLEAFIEYDIWFGNGKPEYSTSCDTQLTTDGAILCFREQSNRKIWVAVIPVNGDEWFVDEWRTEIYRYKREAVSALAAGLKLYDSSREPWDDEDEEDDLYERGYIDEYGEAE